jgi:hypothetical protein
MGRSKSITKCVFSVPAISKTIKRSSFKKRVIVDEPLPIEEPKKKGDDFTIPDVKLGPRRSGLLKRLLEKGRIQKSLYSFKELQLKKCFPELMHSEVDCLDEAELRSRFPKQGVNHKFFSAGSFKYEFHLPCDSENVVVAQILRNGKVRMPHDI